MSDHRLNRFTSIDILRALTMLLMIFVNDLWTLKGTPKWFEHAQIGEDALGLADTVFPSFLFIVGMAIPLSVDNRRKKGDNDKYILNHIGWRGLALIIMGLFLVNGEDINETATGMRMVVWNSICCLAFIALWNDWPQKAPKLLLNSLKVAAVMSLLWLAWEYRGYREENCNDAVRFSTHWWGILGLIGWAYLVSAAVFTLTGGRFIWVLLAWLLFIALCITGHAGWIPPDSFEHFTLQPFSGGAMPAFVLGGVLTTLLLLRFRQKFKWIKTASIFTGLSAVLLSAGLLTRPIWGISKIRATPSWVFICSATTLLAFVLVYTLTEVWGKASWFKFIEPAGNNTLLCYLLPYFAYALVVFLHLSLPETMVTGTAGLLKSLVFALLIIFIAGKLGKIGVRLKL